MKTVLREWRKDDAQVLVGIIRNKKVQDNLRDGIPYPYRKEDAELFAENKASCRVLEKAGFQMEGILRCNAVKNGKVIDMKLYALIK